MSYFSIFILALALSVDACVVSFLYGLKYSENYLVNSVKLAFVTAVFQAIMPVAGYFLTNIIRLYISPYSGLIVFLIFSYLGFKFIIEAYQPQKSKNLEIDIKNLIMIGVATSIDAFSAGITLSLYATLIFKPAILIGLVTFINSIAGFIAGGKFKRMQTKNLEIIAGILLILLAVNALF